MTARRQLARAPLALVCASLCLWSAACGGAGSRSLAGTSSRGTGSVADSAISGFGSPAPAADAQAVRALVERFYAAAARDDGAAACALMYSLRAESVPEDLGQPPGPPELWGATCAAVMAKLFRALPGQTPAVLAATRVSAVRVRENRAIALLSSAAIPEGYLNARREHGVWKVDGVIGSAIPGTSAASRPSFRSSGDVSHSAVAATPSGPRVPDADDGDGDPASNDDEPILYYGHAASPAERSAIATLVRRYYAAAVAGDGAGACGLIYSLIAESLGEEDEGRAGGAPQRTCAAVMSETFRLERSRSIAAHAALRVGRVRIEGSKGLVLVSLGGRAEQHLLVHLDGGVWKLESLSAIGMP